MFLSQKLNSSLNLKRKEREIPLQQFEKGDEIIVLDSVIWQVYRGVIQLSKVKQDGSETVIGWITANGTFGSYLENPTESYRAVAMSNVYARKYLLQDVARDPRLARQFLAQFSDRLVKSKQLLSIIAIKRVDERLRQLLLMLEREMGQPVEEGIKLQARFTHQQLAEAICTTRVTITRVLGDFQNKGAIALDSNRHIICKNL